MCPTHICKNKLAVVKIPKLKREQCTAQTRRRTQCTHYQIAGKLMCAMHLNKKRCTYVDATDKYSSVPKLCIAYCRSTSALCTEHLRAVKWAVKLPKIAKQCIALTKRDKQCSHKTKYGDKCGIHRNTPISLRVDEATNKTHNGCDIKQSLIVDNSFCALVFLREKENQLVGQNVTKTNSLSPANDTSFEKECASDNFSGMYHRQINEKSEDECTHIHSSGELMLISSKEQPTFYQTTISSEKQQSIFYPMKPLPDLPQRIKSILDTEPIENIVSLASITESTDDELNSESNETIDCETAQWEIIQQMTNVQQKKYWGAVAAHILHNS
jgi:hypothetical protein